MRIWLIISGRPGTTGLIRERRGEKGREGEREPALELRTPSPQLMVTANEKQLAIII